MDTSGICKFAFTEERPYEESARRWLCANQGEKPQRNPACTLFLAFQPTELGEYKFVFFKPPSLWDFVMAGLWTDSEKATYPTWTQRLS